MFGITALTYPAGLKWIARLGPASQRAFNMFEICALVLFVCSVRMVYSQDLQTCTCVAANSCYQPLPNTDGSGLIDIRIVTPVNTTTVVPPTTLPPAGITCTGGLEPCCTGAGVTGCGLRYNIPLTPATIPRTGEARYAGQPWVAALLDTNDFYVGGGVLISPNYVLTAAHKVANRTAANVKVRLGEWNASRTVEPYPVQEVAVTTITVHNQYNARNLLNDVAVLRLATPANIGRNPAINTICAPSATTNFDNMRCLVSGWGKNSYTGTYQEVLKEVDVPVVSNIVCQSRLQTTRLGPTFLLNSASFLCAGGEPAKDACVGDGGSPLVCNIGGRYQLAGLVAWGVGCANGNIPGVYVKTNTFLSWIQSVCNCL